MSTSHLDHVYAVVLAGGSGTRLWPKSRDNTPKQFLKLGGNRTMLQRTVDRVLPLLPWDRVIVVTNAKYAEEVQRQLPEVPASNIISEPTKRDTALAMALGALVAQKRDPEAVVMNLASDHVLQDEEGYREVMRAALDLAAQKKHLITVGITPNGPNVNFGYINASQKMTSVNGYTVTKVDSFKEKPDLETAKSFLKTGTYFWNANMYTWHVDAMMEAFAKYMPQSLDGLQKLREAIDTDRFEKVLAEVYESAEKVAIDVAISEKADNLVLLPGDFGWDDIGLWSTVYELGEKDEHNSVIVRDGEDRSQVVQMGSRNNLVSTNGRMVALVGVEDFVIIDSNEVLLVLPREKASDVKKVVQLLEEQGLDSYL